MPCSTHTITTSTFHSPQAHTLKNPDTGIAAAARSVRTKRRLLLTGSPVQNQLDDLWALMDVACPGRLGPRSLFAEHFGVPIARGGKKGATALDSARALAAARLLQGLCRPHLLRRTAIDVRLGLPPREERVVFVRLAPAQAALYRAVIESEPVQRALVRVSGARGIARAGGGATAHRSGTLQDRHGILAALSALRACLNHPDLVAPPSDYGWASELGQGEASLVGRTEDSVASAGGGLPLIHDAPGLSGVGSRREIGGGQPGDALPPQALDTTRYPGGFGAPIRSGKWRTSQNRPTGPPSLNTQRSPRPPSLCHVPFCSHDPLPP